MKRLADLMKPYISLSMIGMCKNAGKTTVFNHLIRELEVDDEILALTSIGRDGEARDVVTGTKKPGISVREGMLFATAQQILPHCDVTKEILALPGMDTPLGQVVVLRAMSDGNVQLAGPSMNEQLTVLSRIFRQFGASRVLIDGAAGRKTLCSREVAEATVLCTGASYHRDVRVVVDDTAYFAEILSLGVVDNSKVAETLKTMMTEKPWRSSAADPMKKNEGGNSKYILLKENAEMLRASASDGLAEVLSKKEGGGYRYVFVSGALSDGLMMPILRSNMPIEGKIFIVSDSSKILLNKRLYEKLRAKRAKIQVLSQIRLAAVAINPFSAYGWAFDKDEFMERMSERITVPVINVEDE